MLRTDLIKPVWQLLATHAAERGRQCAFRDEATERSWEQLFRRTGNLAGALVEAGSVGTCVAMVMENRVELVEAYLAVVRAGAVAACLNARAGNDELAYMIDDCGASILITDTAALPRVEKLLTTIDRSVALIVVGQAEHESPERLSFDLLADAVPATQPDDTLGMHEPAFMLYTSGTTGRPKGVLLSQHSCLWVVAACWAPAFELTADDYILSALPLFHSYALDFTVLAVVAVGATERLLPKFSPAQVIGVLREDPVTVMPGVPTMFDYLVRTLDGQPLNASSLRVCASAGAIMPADLNATFEAATGVPLLDGYGITETSTMVTMNWLQGARPLGSCGIPVPGCAVRLVDPVSGDDVPSGGEGELIVRGPNVMLGYHNNAKATDEALRGGWYHTGDLARSDDCGYLTITGRIKELIIRGGENIYPAEVEQALAGYPGVVDVAVAGEPHPSLGESVVAFVVVEDPDGFDEPAARAYLEDRLAAWKVPQRFELVGEVPRTGSGKIQRRRLFELTARVGTS